MINTRKLKAAIIVAGYSHAMLAEKLKMSVNSFSSKVNGRSKFSIDEATKLCEILGIEDNAEKVDIFLH